ncbi:nitrogen regulation protein NR(II) [Thiomonas bhubaneswarensis]|uniref:histidine kinase n=1 Tax=Thiomonas bhubaneswarensis TaxID=339866 RepID=A0A0K6I705_9BURK|nr:nitrogen regulation protein NR(II) [Thiomonas bhubaneswarensis]CUA98905.1 signal transduction histidine kinase, nitrogen specific, NtrB [Thiomonas bhubaneswarensis]
MNEGAAGSQSTPDYPGLEWLASMAALVDEGGLIQYANPALENGLGVSRRMLQAQNLGHWLDCADLWQEALLQVRGNVFSSKRFDCMMRLRDAVQVQVIVTRTDHPEGLLLVEVVEISQQSRLEREEQWHNQAQANKELIRNLAHEIKNPLGGIRGAAQLLHAELPSAELQEYTQVIIAEADRLQTLVDRLLAPHRKPHVVGDVNIHEVCEHVRTLLQAEFPQGLTIEQDYDASLPEFRGDKEQLIQAVLNIAHNAAQALQGRIATGDARIVFRTRVARQTTVARQRYKLALVLHIVDNGPGVPAELKDRIFFPLISGREGGSGLGLTLAQTFVQQHQGTIECDSQPGHTDFRITLPLP